MEIARDRGLYVIEDACQAHGATYGGRKAGSIGDAAAFSFYPGKNLGAYGEAGAVTTDNDELAAKMRMLRDHGQSRKYYHDVIGWNARMDGIQGAVLSVKLAHLDAWNDLRRRHAAAYDAILGRDARIVAPTERPGGRHVYHVYAVRVRQRDKVLAALQAAGIGAAIHYPVAVHEQTAYAGLTTHRFPVAEQCAQEFLSLPLYPEMTEEQIRAVGDALTTTCAQLDGERQGSLVGSRPA